MPERVTLKVMAGQSVVTLPVRPPMAQDADIPAFQPPEGATPAPCDTLREAVNESGYHTDLHSGVVTYRQWVDEGLTRLPDHDGWTIGSTHEEVYRIHPDDPLSARFDVTWTEEISRGAWQVRTRTRTQMRATRTHFILKGELEAHFGDEDVHRQIWQEEIARDLV
jgi:hypothetical protein